jgi:hypothetical protein
MLALLALHRRTGSQVYLDAAREIGQFIDRFRDTDPDHAYQGFLAGIQDAELPSRRNRVYAATEHQLDVDAAFTLMHQTTGEARWREGAAHAREFVERMWDPALGS